MVNPEDVRKVIVEFVDEFRDMLLEKNRAYNASLFNPERCFNKTSTIEEMILLRMDDKVARIRNGTELKADGKSIMSSESRDDAFKDLMGYICLYFVQQRISMKQDKEKT